MKTVITLDDEKFGGNYYHAAHVEVIRGDKTRSAKYVDVDRLLEAMKNARNMDVFYRIGRLPQNYYDGTIRRESDMTISGHMLLTVSKQRIPLQFEETKYIIPFPALLFCFHIIHGRVCSTEVYALTGTQWNEKSVLYNFPYGNVNVQSHQVCWGSNSLPEITELRKLDVVCSLFYDSPCNNDYFTAERSVKWRTDNLRNVLEKLKEKEEFPEKLLVMSDRGNIGTLIKGIIKKEDRNGSI